MATALQCPECGKKHRLDAVGDQDVFACSQCSRPLKVPAAYRPGANAAAGSGSAGAVARRAGGRKAAASRGSELSIPVKILLWVVAFVLGAVVVRMIAKWTGFVGGNTLVDLLIDHSFSNYFKLFILVPFWALFSTLFLTLFLEGPAWYQRRREGVPAVPSTTRGRSGGPRPAKPATQAAARAAAPAGRNGAIPKRVPASAGSAAAGAAVVAGARPRTIQRRGEVTDRAQRALAPDDRTQALAVAPVVADPPEPEDEYAARAAAGHRPRRIPRRGTGS
jgi:hypothetical protein